MDRQQMERGLERVAAHRASGLKAKAWAQANDVAMRSLASWCAHSRRRQERLDGVSARPSRWSDAFDSTLPLARLSIGEYPGCWHMARTPVLRQALSSAWLKAQGLVSVKEQWCKAQGYTT